MAFNQEFVLQIPFAVIAAGTDETWYAPVPEGTWKLESAVFVPWTARTANDTNYTTITVKKGATTLASEATTTGDTGNLVAGTPVTLVITGTGTSLEFTPSAPVVLGKADSGSGLALDGTFSLTFSAVQV
jgi:hypothetical protein